MSRYLVEGLVDGQWYWSHVGAYTEAEATFDSAELAGAVIDCLIETCGSDTGFTADRLRFVEVES